MFGQMIGETLTFVANAVAMTMLILAARRHTPAEDVMDVDTQIISIITTSIPVIQKEIHQALTGSISIIQDNKTREIKVITES